ncbi:MAG: YkgJ family cysteine cluster protein [bacterium]
MDDILRQLKEGAVEQGKLALDSTLKFNCRKGISCFNTCCGELDIFLTPYDVIRMKSRLGKTSLDFLEEHTEVVTLKKTNLPLVKLKMGEDRRCRFVTPEGCSIYSDRPVACRYYPLGFGALVDRDAQGGDFYFLIREDHCKGFGGDREWTVRQWRDDQGIGAYDEVNKDWVDIVLKKKIRGDFEPDEKSLRMFFMASYDIDSFRAFVFGSRFLDIFDLDEVTVGAIQTEDAALLKFALRWLKYVLFKEPTVALKGT